MKYSIIGAGDVTITSKDYLTQGGEGKIYLKNGVIYKIADDSAHTIPADKIRELSVLARPNIIKPEKIIMKGADPIGYTMSYVADTHSLCQLFTKSFKDRNGVTVDKIVNLIKIFRDTVEYIHAHNILLVDLNELNFLVSQKIDNIYCIDVNSYQTPNYPATAIMESIRDRHNNKFSPGTDWFSFGIVTFQLFMNIHPYKGSHGSLKGLDERMLKNVSVFNPTVRMPGVCPNLSIIPTNLRAWYENIFERGVRIGPPSDFTAIKLVVRAKQVVSGQHLKIIPIEEFEDNAKEVIWGPGGSYVTLLENGSIIYQKRKYGGAMSIGPRDAYVSFSDSAEPHIIYNDIDGNVHMGNFNQSSMGMANHVGRLIQIDDRVYSQNNDNISELSVMEIGNKNFLSAKIVGRIYKNSAQFFDGVIFQSVLRESDNTNTYFVSVFPNPRMSYQIFLKELWKHKIIDAKFQGGILVVIGAKGGIYDRFLFKFNLTYSGYDVIKVDNVPLSSPNFAVLRRGVCALLNEDEKLELFTTTLGEHNVKVVDDPILKTGIRLTTDGERICGIVDNKLFQIKTI